MSTDDYNLSFVKWKIIVCREIAIHTILYVPNCPTRFVYTTIIYSDNKPCIVYDKGISRWLWFNYVQIMYNVFQFFFFLHFKTLIYLFLYEKIHFISIFVSMWFLVFLNDTHYLYNLNLKRYKHFKFRVAK